MADIQANIGIGVDTTQALAAIRQLQREISVFHTLMAKGGANAAAKSLAMQQGLINTINETGKFSASMTRISSSTESFTNALEKNKLSMGQYFRYAGGASKTFGKAFAREFDTINRVATERVKDLQTQYISMGRDANGALQAIKVRPLALDMDNLGTKVMLASQKQQIFNQLMKQGTTNLLNFGKNTQWAGRQLMVGFTIPLTIFGATAAREFQKLEEQAVKFRRVYGDMFSTEADTEKALKNVRELADEFTKYGIAVEKTIGLAAKVAQMGNMGTDLTEQVTQATKLAVLGGMEQEEALDTTISLTNAFGIAAEDLAGKIAFLNAAENQTILSIQDFNEAIPKAGSVVQQLGGSVEDLAFFLTAMREGGINASQGANALKTSLARLVAPTEVAKKEMAEFGIDIVGIVESNAGNLRNTVMTLGAELDKLDPLNRSRAIEQLFGKFQFARMSTMFQNISREGSQAAKVLQLTTATTEELAIVAERELKRVEESPAFRLQKQMEQLRAALAPIGEEFIKAVGPLIEFGTKLLKSFNNLGDGSKQFIVVLTAIAGVIAPAALMAFGLIANGVANLLKFFQFLGKAFGMLSGKSTLLGGQTEYMTQQQIEAASVAASLGQTHNNLTQIFTAEATAIQNLVAQYRAAIVEQRRLSVGQTARGVAGRSPRGAYPRGFAKGGIIRGPGTGTSDSIMAMLSDGEAVIPAEQVKRYRSAVEQLISGNIPGFAFGEIVGGPGTYRAVGPSAIMAKGNTATTPIDMGWLASSPIAPISTSSAIKTQRESATGTGYNDISAEGQAAVEYAGQKLQEHAQNTSSFVDAAQLAYQDTLRYLDEQVAANKMSAQEAKEIADATRVTLAPTKEDVLSGEVAFPRQGLEERDGAIVAGKPRDERKGTSNKKRARNRLRQELESSGYDSEEALAIAEDRELSFAHVQDSIKMTQEEAEGLGLDTTPKLREKSEQLPQELDLLRRKSAGEKVSRGTALAGSEADLEALEQEAAAVGTNIVRSQIDASESEAGIGSPAKRFIEIGRNIVNSTAMGMEEAGEQQEKAPLPGNLEAPKPPVTPEVSQSRSGKLFSGLKAKAGSIGNKAMDAVLETGPGKKMANYFAETSGADITNSEGKVVSTLHQEIKELGEASDRAADQVKENTDAVKENGQASSKGGKSDIARDNAGNPIIGPDGKPLTNKQVKQEAKRQGRQRRASVAAGIMGTATMAVGMATQVDAEVFGFNIGEMAQKIMPVVGALAVLGPMLLAMSGPLALLTLAVVGIGAAYMAYQAKLKEVTEAARELAENLGSGSKAMGRFAEFAGKASATEIMNQRRQLGEINVAMGKSEFGENFVASDQGKEFIQTIESGFEEIGRSGTMEKLGVQLATAVSTNILTAEQAAGIAAEVGREMGDLSISMDLLGNLTELIGPGGQNLLTDPLEVFMKVIDISAADTEKSIDALVSEIVNPGGQNNNGFFSGLFDVPELQAGLAGNIIALQEQVQSQLDAQVLAHEQNIARYKEENALLEEQAETLEGQGRGAEAEEKRRQIALNLTEIAKAENQYLTDRATLLDKATTANSQILAAQEEAASLQEKIATIGNVLTFTGDRGGDIEYVRGAIEDLVNMTGIELDFDLESADPSTLRKKYNELRNEFANVDKIANGFQGTLEQMGTIITDRLEEDDPLRKKIDQLTKDTDIEYEVRFNLIQGMATGAIDIQQVEQFLNDFPVKAAQVEKNADLIANKRNELIRSASGIAQADFYAGLTDEEIANRIVADNQRIQDSFSNIVNVMGQGANQQLMNIFGRIEDVGLQEDITTKIGLLVEGGSPEELDRAQQMLDMFSMLSSYGENTIDREATMAFYLENPEAFTEFQTKMSEFDSLTEEYGDDLTAEVVLSSEFFVDDAQFNAFKESAEYFDSLPAGQRKVFVSTFLTQFATIGSMQGTAEGTEAFEAFKAEKIAGLGSYDNDSAISNIQNMSYEDFVTQSAVAAAKKVTAALAEAGILEELEVDNGDGAGGATPQIDNLIKKLRDLRRASIDMKKGWEGMQQVLQSVFAGGTQQINVFDGLANQIRRLGVGEGLLEMIVGMDPDEFEKRKNELFEFDGTRIVGATAALKNMNAAFNAVALGEYVNGQQAFIEKTKNQISAISILTAAGLSLADAYEVVQDAATAAAIAQGASAEQIQELIRFTKLAKEEEAKLERERERSRISESVRKTNEEFRNQVAVLQQLSREQGKYTDAQITALMSDQDLQKLMLDPTIDDGALQEALRNAEQKANLEVQVNLLTKSGQETEFDKYLAEVNDYFTKEENLINVNFDLATADDNKLIEDAQNQIAAIQYKLDDYNAELEQISWIEEDINEKYDKRSEALDSIADANEKIANQQKAQLDIADALSKGDISAAAKAIQELRSQEAQQAQETQKDQLERAREAELKAIVGPSGRTKEQLEEEITQLERQLFFIEEQTLEPAQERNRLAEITRDLAIDQLRLNELTRMEFDKIAASTKQSAINMEDMIKSSEKLAALAEFIQTGKKGADWNRLFPQPKAAAPAPRSSGGGGGGGGGPQLARKDEWTFADGSTLGEKAAAAGMSWNEFYNNNRHLDSQLIPKTKADGGLIGKYAMGGLAKRSRSGPPLQMAMGGKVGRYANGGMIIPKRMAMGGYSMGSDIIPAILTPGEFVVRRPAVSAFGVDKLESINRGTYNDGSVYNYNLAVNVKSDSDPNRIARAVITNIKSIENQRIRGNKL